MGIFSAAARLVTAPVTATAAAADMVAAAAATTVTTTVTTMAEAANKAAHRYLPLPTGHVAGTVVKVYPDGRKEVIYSPV